MCEALETRLVPTATELSLLAADLGVHHDGPTSLFLNFDGGSFTDSKGNTYTASPFQSPSSFLGGGPAHDVDQDIQEILYRTSEIFAPFNVRVTRLQGAGAYYGQLPGQTDGATTVFIGDGVGNSGANNGAQGLTPGTQTDYPGNGRGNNHTPNSDPYDVTFADPVSQAPGALFAQSGDNVSISRTIAHEAGHTFGLAHVRSDQLLSGVKDDTKPLGVQQVPDIMSYDHPLFSGPNNVYFANKFLDTTDWNNSPPKGLQYVAGSQRPNWQGTTITKQNSYAYLKQVLGSRPADDHANVADLWGSAVSSVDKTAYTDSPLTDVAPGGAATGRIDWQGDYDVFRITAPANANLSVTVKDLGGQTLRPVAMLFDGNGQSLLKFGNDHATPGSAKVTFRATAGQTYMLVVGADNGTSTGRYSVNVTPVAAPSLADVVAETFATVAGVLTKVQLLTGPVDLYADPLLDPQPNPALLQQAATALTQTISAAAALAATDLSALTSALALNVTPSALVSPQPQPQAVTAALAALTSDLPAPLTTAPTSATVATAVTSSALDSLALGQPDLTSALALGL
jgi:hypothetical protein